MADVATFGQRLRARRRELGLSLRELAPQVGIYFTTLSKIETDRLLPPDATTIARLARALDVDPAEWTALAGKSPRANLTLLRDELAQLAALVEGHNPEWYTTEHRERVRAALASVMYLGKLD